MGADSLCAEMNDLMHDYEVMSRINDLVAQLKGTYEVPLKFNSTEASILIDDLILMSLILFVYFSGNDFGHDEANSSVYSVIDSAEG